jgi:hypothetical protein
MADRPLKLRELRKLLGKYGVTEDASLGKGSHTMFLRKINESVFSYPVPTHGRDVLPIPYVKGCRKKFKLTEKDGVTDKEFYSK